MTLAYLLWLTATVCLKQKLNSCLAGVKLTKNIKKDVALIVRS